MRLREIETCDQAEWALEHDDELVRDLVDEILDPRNWKEDRDSEDKDLYEVLMSLDHTDVLPRRTIPPAWLPVHTRIRDDLHQMMEGYSDRSASWGWAELVELRPGRVQRGYGYAQVYIDIPERRYLDYQSIPGLECFDEDVVLRILQEYAPRGEHTACGWGFCSKYPSQEDSFVLIVDEARLYETIVDDKLAEFEVMVSSRPERAIETMFSNLDSDIVRRMKKLKLPRESLLAYAHAYLTDPEDGEETIRAAIGEYDLDLDDAEVLTTISRTDLRDIGVTADRWVSGAPWSLIALTPERLPHEGAMQRHCIGRPDMPYVDQLRDGQIYAWSLRSFFNKPVLTFEVDREAWDLADHPLDRAEAITQIKGKLNRDPPEDEDERRVLELLGERMGFSFDDLGIS